MNKKIVYILVVIVLMIAGIFVATKISNKNETKQTASNTVEKVNNTNKENLVEENNIVESEQNEVEDNVVDENGADKNVVEENQTQESPEEQAKQIVKDNWGEDDSVYYSYDGKDENGKYIICVRDKETTKALYWYYVDIETGSFDIK